MTLIDVEFPVTGVDAFLTKLGVKRAKHVQPNGEFEAEIRPAELKPIFVRNSEHGVFGMRRNKTDSGFAQNGNASGLTGLSKEWKSLDDIK